MPLKKTNPIFVYPSTKDEFLKQVEGRSVIIGYDHPGKTETHDPIAALTSMKNIDNFMERVDSFRVWGKLSIMNNFVYRRITSPLGLQVALRKKEVPDIDTRRNFRAGLLDVSANHINENDGSIAIFTPGERESADIKPGFALLASQVLPEKEALILPISIGSSNASSGYIPKDLVISYGEPIPVVGNQVTANDYVVDFKNSLDGAVSRAS